MTTHPQWVSYWKQYAYTYAAAEALTRAFGVGFGNENTGGGCICITNATQLEGGLWVYVGSASDGPLLTAAERQAFRARRGYDDGYGVSICDDDGYAVAHATDLLADTPDDVVALVKRALSLVPGATATEMLAYHRGRDGAETTDYSAR
jgi:hypothetical protein